MKRRVGACVRSSPRYFLCSVLLLACAPREDGGISVDPDTVVFGLVPAGESRAKTVRVRNRGMVPVKIRAIEILDDARGVFAVDALANVLLSEGGAMTIGVVYRPVGPGGSPSDVARLRVSSDAQHVSDAIVTLRGESIVSPADGGAVDARLEEAGAGDAAGASDATAIDAVADAGIRPDALPMDAVPLDAGNADAALQDAAAQDMGLVGPPDAGCAVLNISPPSDLDPGVVADTGDDTRPHVASDGIGTWIAVWSSNSTLGGAIGSDGDILFSRSEDNGTAWSPPSYLNTNAPSDAFSDIRPRVVNSDGVWIAVWNNPQWGESYSARSLDDGITWSDPIEVGPGGVEPDDDRAPDLAAYGNVVVVVWSAFEGANGNVFSARSVDLGLTWEPEVAITSNGLSEGLPRIAQLNGVFTVVFHGHLAQGGDGEILLAQSPDLGASWSAPLPLNSDALSDTIDDDSPAIAVDGSSNHVVVWRDTKLGRIFTSRSLNNGIDWSARGTLALPGWVESAPTIATDRVGQWIAIWHATASAAPQGPIGSDGDIIGAGSNTNGATWSLETLINSGAATDFDLDQQPELAADGRGNWVFVWSSNADGDFDIGFARGTCGN